MPGKAWQRWNWLESGLLPLLGALMWAAWLAWPLDSLLALLTAGRAPGGALAALAGLVLAGTLSAELARRARWGRWLVAAAGILALAAAQWWLLYRGAFAIWDVGWLAQAGRLSFALLAVLLISAFMLWRGVTANWVDHNALTRDFVLGVVGLALSLSASGSPLAAGRLAGYTFLFLVAGWAALSLAAVLQAPNRGAAGDSPAGLNRYWLLTVVGVIAAVSMAGLLIASIVTPGALAGLFVALRPLREAALLAIAYFFYAAFFVAYILLTPITWLLSLFGAQDIAARPELPALPPRPENEQLQIIALAPWAQAALNVAVIVGLLVLIGLLLAWALRRFAPKDVDGVRESRELILSWDLLRAQMAGLLPRRPGPTPLFAPLAGDRQDATVRTRAAYRRLLGLALQRENPRQPGQTPDGYLQALQALWPSEQGLLARLTRAYVAARSGQQPPSAEALAEIESGLDDLPAR